LVALNELSRASFRGVGFLVPDDDVEEGPNSIRHEYPDRRSQYIEDNGGFAPQFQVKAILKGPGVVGKLNALRNALNARGPGTLRHPYYGSRRCSVMGPYKVHRSDGESGPIRLDITFAETAEAMFASGLGAIAAQVPGLAGVAGAAIAAALAGGWQTGLSALSNGVLSQAVGSAFGGYAAAFPGAAGVVALAGNIVGDAGTLIGAPAELAGCFEKMSGLVFGSSLSDATICDGFGRMASVFGGDLAAARAGLEAAFTPDLAGRFGNLTALASAGRGFALLGMAEACAGKSYVTADAVASDVRRLAGLKEELAA
jgi:hypothetical protein